MRVTCPACHAEVSLDALLEHEAGRHAMARLATASLPFGALVLRYIGLFRPAKRRLSIDRMVLLIEELLPDIERGAIQRKGRDWPADHEAWRGALQAVLTARDAERLKLPLTTHAYLYEVLLDHADKAEARAEKDREADRRTRQAEPAAPTSDAAQRSVVAPRAVPPPPGPGFYARKLRAQIDAINGKQATGEADGTEA